MHDLTPFGQVLNEICESRGMPFSDLIARARREGLGEELCSHVRQAGQARRAVYGDTDDPLYTSE